MSGERVSAGHVEQEVSWFDRKYKVVSPEETLYRKTASSGRSSRSKLEPQRSRTWRQSPGRPVWISGVEPDPLELVRVASGPVKEEVVSAGPYTASMPYEDGLCIGSFDLFCELCGLQLQGSGQG